MHAGMVDLCRRERGRGEPPRLLKRLQCSHKYRRASSLGQRAGSSTLHPLVATTQQVQPHCARRMTRAVHCRLLKERLGLNEANAFRRGALSNPNGRAQPTPEDFRFAAARPAKEAARARNGLKSTQRQASMRWAGGRGAGSPGTHEVLVGAEMCRKTPPCCAA